MLGELEHRQMKIQGRKINYYLSAAKKLSICGWVIASAAWWCGRRSQIHSVEWINRTM
jgi:hypothetical protein